MKLKDRQNIIVKENIPYRRAVSIGFLFLVIILGGCEKELAPEKEIILPPTPILSNEKSWAVVIESYVKVTEEKDKNSTVKATLRKGAVLEIISSELENDGSQLWYRVKGETMEGWIGSGSVKKFENLEQAETASREADRVKE
ncbi:MAG: hypothetical protein PQJ59_15755 [Spirochaetales bacterium]|nr:hypothetical protein [Spirochaetales bacterium]